MESGIYNEHLEENLFGIYLAETSLRERDTAAIEMHDAIRQAKKYLSSCNPSIKILKQKLSKVSEKGEEAKQCHFAHCRKAKIELQTEGATLFIMEMSDYITDCVDDGLFYIEQRELDELSKNKLSGDAAVEEEKRLVKMSKSTRLMSQLKTDGILARETASTIEDVIQRDEFSNLNPVLMKSYDKRLHEIGENLNKSWNDIISLHDTERDLESVSRELNFKAMKLKIHSVHSEALVFIEKCSEMNTLTSHTPTPVQGETSSTKTLLRPEKIKLPTFSGNIRNFTRFKKDFEKIVVPFYSNPVHQAFVLKEICLRGNAKKLVENIEDSNRSMEIN